MERLKTREKVVGLKQTQKAILKGRAELAYVAEDADFYVREPLMALCKEHGVEIFPVATMKDLAKACRVEVPTACAVLMKSE